MTPLPRIMIEPAVRAALLEDLGRAGDITAEAVIPDDTRAAVAFVAREPGTIAGLGCAAIAFDLLDPSLALDILIPDGGAVAPGDVIARIEGKARAILSAERTALNFLGQLSGVATATAGIAAAIAHTGARITCTRKTIPGLRALQKYAVRCGGGANHRFGLDDAVLIKDNHIAIAGGAGLAVRRARAAVGHLVKIECEVDRLDQLAEALEAGADAVLLDNMDPATLRRAVAMAKGRAITEASGRITPESAPAIAETGVDLISAGWLTHSARVLDIGLDFMT
ncbi:carboxylating nicotinate-nucleotide diphosphorylase [Acidiphilium sp.]|uniref:carboxylating nicotinate-nucleotide diphosphorylase n=1 Tax=Acidiphilium sp. TaxID=527 RepID=UPI0025872ACE|nr:carboxylating nicotinate-nucleotide diphosphorylase [Acidiphilium sp.]